MQQPSSTALPAPRPAIPPVATETVTRPDPGLARGRWEAPAWAFYVALAVIVVAAAAYVALRSLRVRVRRRKQPEA